MIHFDELSKLHRRHQVYSTPTMIMNLFWDPFDSSESSFKVMFSAIEGHLLDMELVEATIKEVGQWFKTKLTIDHANLVLLDSKGRKTQLANLGSKGPGRMYG